MIKTFKNYQLNERNVHRAVVNVDVIPEYEYMVNHTTEQDHADSFVWHPTPPVTVKSVDIEGLDEFNGDNKIELSNDDVIHYQAKETRGGQGPSYEIRIMLNDKLIDDGDQFEMFQGSGSWTADLLHFYKDYKTKNPD